MRGEGDLQPAAQSIAVNRRDHGFGARIEHLVGALSRNRRWAPGAELADVGAGDKAPSGADQHHRLDRGVGIAALDILDDALGHARAQRVDRRVVDGDDADPFHILKANQCAFRHFNLPGIHNETVRQ